MAKICASTNNSPNLRTISLYSVPTKPSARTLQPSSSSSYKLELSVGSEDTFTIVAAVEAVSLANAAAQAARDVLVLLQEESEFQCGLWESCGKEHVSDVKRRRRKRKKQRKEEFVDNYDMETQFSSRKASSACLTVKEEAEFTLHLKEGAMLEAAARTRACDVKESGFTTSQWAESMGMKRRSLERILCKSRESRQRITISYRRLVVSIATAYQGKGLSLEDLIQEGSIGLLRGAEKFDPMKGFKLSTYVYWWIKQAIIRAIANKSRLIRLPGSLCEMIPKIAEANDVLSTRLRRKPTYEEIASMTDFEVSRIRLICERNMPPLSLHQSWKDTGCMTLQEIVPGQEEMQPETMMKKQVMKTEISRLLTQLTEREALILKHYFGLNGETCRSCEEIGRLLNLSRERVRQIHYIALTKLRHMNRIDNVLSVYIMT